MRIIGHLPSEANATTFGDFLSVEGIENEIEPEKEGWAIWVRSEDEWPRAQEMLTTFLADPRDPRFSGKTERARELRQKAAADAEAVQRTPPPPRLQGSSQCRSRRSRLRQIPLR